MCYYFCTVADQKNWPKPGSVKNKAVGVKLGVNTEGPQRDRNTDSLKPDMQKYKKHTNKHCI